ncbi:MAG TPA: hypothetical protein PKC43_08845 [Phycisphaerales bacterium]|nr:hypothetical protein [Phycisphaerales bacterium]HMP37543.1 hypothetical protein [Phycisphaerales bacterium]
MTDRGAAPAPGASSAMAAATQASLLVPLPEGERSEAPLIALLAAILAIAVSCGDAAAQLRVVSYNVAQLRGDAGALQAVFAEMAFDESRGFALAPAAIALQEVRAVDRPVIEALVAASIPAAYATATFTTSPGEDASGGAQMLLYRVDRLQEIASSHVDLPTGGGRNSDRWRLRLVGYDDPRAALWIYGVHLKAGSTASDVMQRLTGAQLLLANAAALPAGAHVIFAGDMNFSANSEPGYQAFIAAGPAQATDPLGSGPWGGPLEALKHTQSPRDIQSDGLIGGGMDDRFDFQLLGAEVVDQEGIFLMPGTYRALGNDGLHFNQAINAGNNFYFPGDVARSNALADALFDASDHIPVVADYTVPAIMSAAIIEEFGAVIQGATFGVPVFVANIADVLVPAAADVLTFSAQGFGDLFGVVPGAVAATGAPATVHVPLDTSTVGFVQGLVQVTSPSEAVQNPSFLFASSGMVLRPSLASLDLREVVTVREFEFTVPAGTGTATLEIPIHNFGFDAQQALLDVDAATGLAAPIAVGLPLPREIGAEPGLLRFEVDRAAAPGVYGAAVTITCSDEDLPGETTTLLGALLTVAIVEEMGILGDLDGNGIVDGADLGLLLSAWGPCTGCAADLNDDGVVNGSDLGILLGAWQ